MTAYYAPPTSAGEITYQPHLLGVARIIYSDAKLKVSGAADAIYLTGISDAAIPVDWQKSKKPNFIPMHWKKFTAPGCKFR